MKKKKFCQFFLQIHALIGNYFCYQISHCITDKIFISVGKVHDKRLGVGFNLKFINSLTCPCSKALQVHGSAELWSEYICVKPAKNAAKNLHKYNEYAKCSKRFYATTKSHFT